jgi:hypothetical protein
MNNGDMPANPLASEELSDRFIDGVEVCAGLTKREHFAGLAMQANIIHHGTHGGYSFSEKQCAEHSIAQADALLKELEK